MLFTDTYVPEKSPVDNSAVEKSELDKSFVWSVGSFNDYLRSTVQQHLATAPKNLQDSVLYSIDSPGKRLRPFLMYSIAHYLKVPWELCQPAAASIEILHCFTLIHDDLPCMDNADYRRGILSTHKKFSETVALLAGDGMIPLSLEILLTLKTSHEKILHILNVFLQAIGPAHGVVAGQALELTLTLASSLEDCLLMHEQKTTALFMPCVMTPVLLAGVPDEVLAHMEGLGKKIGFIYQIVDDLEDKESTPNSILNYKTVKEVKDILLVSLKDLDRFYDPNRSSAKYLKVFFKQLEEKIKNC